MSPLLWLTNNVADTSGSEHPDVNPLEMPLPINQALVQIESTIRQLPRWHVEAVNGEDAKIHATRRSRLFKFIDDVHVRVAEQGDKSIVHARSQSRVGKGDLGQNRRNILELFGALA